ncbi:MAG: NAD-dependent epimerase/dehydratase family protein [Candidatus Aminicenantes bacterium]|nr:NAD-dependent epimerase/dehydratase family protein [Candidatus Aminicenantes bacterium]
MKRVCVTGATGYLGMALAWRLAVSGIVVHALFRSKAKAANLNHPNIRLVKGDILHPESLDKAVKDCDYLYHTAALTAIWSENPSLFREVNVRGTKNILEKAVYWGIKKVVMTSTAGIYGPSLSCPVDEECHRTTPCFTEYERTKEEADSLALGFSRKKGLDLVIVCPTRIYGPGPLVQSNSVTLMIDRYLQGKWHVLPGNGKSIGNYVYIDDVVNGQILAMEKGRAYEKYLLGGTNISYEDFFEVLKEVTQKRFALFKVPFFFMMSVAGVMTLYARLLRRVPMVTPQMMKKLHQNWMVSIQKAELELEYKPIPLKKGIQKTVDWLNLFPRGAIK